MSSAIKRVLKMGAWFSLFFVPFLWCVFRLVSTVVVTTVIKDPVYHQRFEPVGFGLVFLGLGAALFGRELSDAVHDWRRTHRRGQRRKPKGNGIS